MIKVKGLIDAKADAFSSWLNKNEIDNEVVDAIPSEYIFDVDIAGGLKYSYLPHIGKHLFEPCGSSDVNNVFMIHNDDVYKVEIG